ncbi:MAG: glycosyltransferase involved in cell wall biosynthesis [Hyphomicrobiaceae bacterium]
MSLSSTSEPRDVVYVVASMITGGTQTHLLQVFRFLDRAQWRPHLYVLRDGGDLVAAARALDVEVTSFGMRGSLRSPSDMFGLLRLRQSLRKTAPSVVHGYLLRGNFYGALAARLAGVPAIVTSKRGLHQPAGAAERFAVSISNRLCDVITGNSPQVLEFTREIEGPSTPMEMIPSGIDVAAFDPDAVAVGTRQRLRAELGIGEAPVVGTAITFRPRKGFRLLFESFSDALAEHPDAHLLVAGAAEMSPEAADLAAELGLEARIHLLGRRADMPEVLTAFDVFVLPSESEGMSNAILEAMAMRLPVVATAVGGAPVVIDEGITGFLVDYPDRNAMAALFCRLLGDRPLREAIGAAARPVVVDGYSGRSMVGKMESLYARVLGGKV